MRFRRLVIGSSITALAAAGLVGSTASATDQSTPPPGPVAPAPDVAPFISTLEGPVNAKQDGIKLKTRGDATVRTFTLRYPVGSYSGWHSHPGLVLAVVKSGKVVRRLPCKKPETFSAGQAFVETGTHYVRNYYTDTSNPNLPAADLLITQIFPASTDLTKLREDQPAPKCHPGS
jgi:hypothetical protein